MKILNSLFPIAAISCGLVSRAHAAPEAVSDAAQQALYHPSALAIIGLGGLLSVCFFFQRSR